MFGQDQVEKEETSPKSAHVRTGLSGKAELSPKSVRVRTGSSGKDRIESEVSPCSDRIKWKKKKRVRSRLMFRQDKLEKAVSGRKSAHVRTGLSQKRRNESEATLKFYTI
jgi:hypothetical protein